MRERSVLREDQMISINPSGHDPQMRNVSTEGQLDRRFSLRKVFQSLQQFQQLY